MLPWQQAAIYSYERKWNPRYVANLHCECQELKSKVEANTSLLVRRPFSGVDTVKTVGSHLKCQQALKIGYFYWLRVKRSNHLHTELNLGYLKGTEFCLEIKASFIDISNIASFKPFLIAWLREYCTFSDNSVVNLKSSPWPNTPSWEAFSKNNNVLLSNFFPLQICSSLDYS